MSPVLGLIAAVAAPLAIALAARAWALRPLRTGGRPAFFVFGQLVPWIGLLAFALWVPAALRWVTPGLGTLALPVLLRSATWGLVLLGPPILIWCALGILVQDVARHAGMSDWTLRDALADGLVMLGGALVPIALLLAALDAARATRFREATVLTIAGVAIGVAAAGRQNRRSGLTPHAVTSGELRDRVFALAARAGVRLQQLYVVPFRRFRMANAFALQGNMVTLTDLLLRELDRDEVDAVLAHEMAHLARRDPDRLALVMSVALSIPIALAMAGAWVAAAVVFPLSMAAVLAFTRRCEYATDARALTFGVRAESLISGLRRLHGISGVPLRWTWPWGLFITHPSFVQRAWKIAVAARLDGAVLAALIASPPPPGPRHAVPSSIDAPRVFGTALRQRWILGLSWSLLAAAAVVPALVIGALGPFGSASRPAGLALATLAALAAWILGWAFATAWAMRRLERTLARLLPRAEAGTRPQFVGLAPDATPRLYEGFSAWDAGFLWVAAGRLHYVGEEAAFSLEPGQIEELAVDGGLPGWIPMPGVRVTWTFADGRSGTFRLVPLGGWSALEARSRARQLHARLEAWRAGVSGTVAGVTIAPPRMEVTSAAPRDSLTMRAIATTVVVLGLLSLGAAFLVGLPIHPMVRGWFDASFASTLAYLLVLAPVLAWRAPAPRHTARDAQDRAA